jgi:putative transcriptional regulator
MESPLKGKVLVASPQLVDPNFARAIVLIVQHDVNGAMGLVLNRPLETTVGEAWTQVSAVPYQNEDPLFQGGPCEGPLMVVHRERARGQIEILGGAEGIYLASDAEVVKGLVAEVVEPLKFFVGYAGWAAMQLEMEVGEGSWEVAGVGVEEVFATPEGVWEKLFKEASRVVPAVDPRRIPPDASVN